MFRRAPGAVTAAFLAVAAVLGLCRPAVAADEPRHELAGHGGPVTSVAVSPDGRRALTGGFDYSLMLWDLADGAPPARLHGHDAAVTAVAFVPPDGRRAVSASDDGTVALWDLEAGRLLHRFEGHAGKVAAVAASPDGRLAASAGWDRTVRLWDLGARRPLRALEGHADNVNAVAFTADGERLVTGGYDGAVRVWRVEDGAPLFEFDGHGFGVNAVATAGRDAGLAASASVDETVRLWDLAGGGERAALYGHLGPVLAVALSPDGRLVASGGTDGAVRVWRTGDGERVAVHDAHDGGVWSVAFAPDGRLLLSAGADGAARVWAVGTGAGAGAPTADGPDREPAGPVATAGAAREEAGRGAALFRACAGCHTVTPDGGNRAGPTLYRLFGRRAGSVPGYPYSEALRDSDIVWNARTIGALFARGPHEFTPGSKMPLQRVPDPEDRAALVEHLRRVTAPAAAR